MASSLRINGCGALGNPLETVGRFALDPFSWAMTSECLQGASTPAYKRNERNANPRNGVWQIIEQAMRDIRSCAVCVTRRNWLTPLTRYSFPDSRGCSARPVRYTRP